MSWVITALNCARERLAAGCVGAWRSHATAMSLRRAGGLTMSNQHVNENVEVVVLPGDSGRHYTAEQEARIREQVRDRLLLTSTEPYQKVQVQVEHLPDGTPASLVAAMLRKHTYTADIVTMKVDPEFNVTSIERN